MAVNLFVTYLTRGFVFRVPRVPKIGLGVGRVNGEFKTRIVLPKNFIARSLLTEHRECYRVDFTDVFVFEAPIHADLCRSQLY